MDGLSMEQGQATAAGYRDPAAPVEMTPAQGERDERVKVTRQELAAIEGRIDFAERDLAAMVEIRRALGAQLEVFERNDAPMRVPSPAS